MECVSFLCPWIDEYRAVRCFRVPFLLLSSDRQNVQLQKAKCIQGNGRICDLKLRSITDPCRVLSCSLLVGGPLVDLFISLWAVSWVCVCVQFTFWCILAQRKLAKGLNKINKIPVMGLKKTGTGLILLFFFFKILAVIAPCICLIFLIRYCLSSCRRRSPSSGPSTV